MMVHERRRRYNPDAYRPEPRRLAHPRGFAALRRLPDPLNSEREHARRLHLDLEDLSPHELARELVIVRVAIGLVDPCTQAEYWALPWFVERERRLIDELRLRQRGAAR